MKKFFYVLTVMLLAFSCSSAPKRMMVSETNSSHGYHYFEQANGYFASGQYDLAWSMLDKAYRIGVQYDNSTLLAKVLFSAISESITYEENGIEVSREKTILTPDVEKLLSLAKSEICFIENNEFYVAVCSLYEVRHLLSLKKMKKTDVDFVLCKNKLEGIEKKLSKELYYLGYFYRVQGELFQAFEKYADALLCFEKAAKIFVDARYLFEIASNYYDASRCAVKLSDREKALHLIKLALKYDRDSESSSCISMDYILLSKILLMENPSEDDKKLSDFYAKRGQCIIEAGIYDDEKSQVPQTVLQ